MPLFQKEFPRGDYEDGAELDGRLHYRISTAFHLITVMHK